MNTSVEKTMQMLHEKYGKSVLTRNEMANEMGISISTLTVRIREGIDIPDYLKNGKAANASVTFPIQSIAEYLHRTTKVV